MSDGGYAEFVSVPVENLVPIPDRDRFRQSAAAFPLTFLTAWHMLMTRAPICTPGDTVLVLAGRERRRPGRDSDRETARRARVRDGGTGEDCSRRVRSAPKRSFDHYAGDFAKGCAPHRRPRRRHRRRARRRGDLGAQCPRTGPRRAGWSPAAQRPGTRPASICGICLRGNCHCSAATWAGKLSSWPPRRSFSQGS